MPVFEDLVLLLIVGVVFFFVGIPMYKTVRQLLPPPKRDSLAEAKERLEQAKRDREAQKLNQQADQMYDDMYKEALEEDEEKQEKKHK